MRMEEYLETLTGQIRCKLARGPVKEEIRCHIEDQKDAYIEDGLSEEEAEEAAVLDMGDPVKTGEEFDRIHRPQMPWRMIGLIIMTSLAGFWLQYQIIGQISGVHQTDINFGRQFLFLLFGFAVMIAVCYVDYSRIVSRATLLFLWFQFILNFCRDWFGVEVNGSVIWFHIPQAGITINTAMLVWLNVPLFAAMLCEIRGNGYFGLFIVSAVMLFRCWSVITWSSLSSAAVLFISLSFLVTMTVWKGWFRVSRAGVLTGYWGAVATAAGWLAFNIINAPHTQTRFHRLFGLGDGISYQIDLVRQMLRGAKWIGEGSWQGENILSGADYMLVYIIHKYGIAAAVVIIMGLLALIILLLRKALAQKNYSGMLIGVSCSMVFLAQIMLYLLSNFGLINTTGYCPFLTYGGSGIVVNFLILGLLLCVFRYENVMSLYIQKRPEEYGEKREWKYEEQARILVIVVILFVALLVNVR